MKKNLLFSLIIFLMITKSIAQPITSAPTPPQRNAANVISLFSDAYANVTGTDFNPGWGQSGFAAYSRIAIGTDSIKEYGNINYQGWQFSPNINAASMTYLHLDIWTSNCTALDVFLIDYVAPEQSYKVVTTINGWTSIDIPLSSYTRPITSIGQFKFVSTPFGGPTVYLDNVYFWTAASLPTLTGFSIPAKVIGDAPFAITNPSSNSAGAYSYSSSNTDVATVLGNMVTINGVGTSTITVTQAAAGSYGSGSAASNLVVTYNPPTVAAPTPSTPAADVISLLSNSYSNRIIDTWSASWDVADVADVTIAGNNTKLYTNLNYSGIEFTGANLIDASNMLYYHVDVWTPNSSPIKVKLVDFGANGIYDGGDDASSIEYVLSPSQTPGVWNSYNIPLSAFSGLTTKAHLAQMLFIGSATTVYVDNVYLSRVSTTFFVLPVTLTDFKVAKRGNTNLLSWVTLTEINSKTFIAERSGNGIDWSTIQVIDASGNSNTNIQYSATDNSPLRGINYYRIKLIDANGKFSYSKIVALNGLLGIKNFTVFPNPFVSDLKVSITSEEISMADFRILSVDGKILITRKMPVQKGDNIIVLKDLGNLSKGNYVLEVTTPNNKLIQKLLKH